MAGPALPDDRELARWMALAQAGDRAAYAQVLRGCVDLVGALCSDESFLCDEARVASFLRTVHAARHTFHPQRSFTFWVAAIARHHGLSPTAPSCSPFAGPIMPLSRWWMRVSAALRYRRQALAAKPDPGEHAVTE